MSSMVTVLGPTWSRKSRRGWRKGSKGWEEQFEELKEEEKGEQKKENPEEQKEDKEEQEQKQQEQKQQEQNQQEQKQQEQMQPGALLTLDKRWLSSGELLGLGKVSGTGIIYNKVQALIFMVWSGITRHMA